MPRSRRFEVWHAVVIRTLDTKQGSMIWSIGDLDAAKHVANQDAVLLSMRR